ncbi:MAG: hypothetical protein HYX41_02385, partial [Bdellovibrio sp.]|nr:hypothetical protein [Bdellovibrio sp.]
FSDQVAAVLLIQSQAKGSDLAALIRGYLENPVTLESIERKVSSFYKPNAASDVVEALS